MGACVSLLHTGEKYLVTDLLEKIQGAPCPFWRLRVGWGRVMLADFVPVTFARE